jgi:hypothetical protein
MFMICLQNRSLALKPKSKMPAKLILTNACQPNEKRWWAGFDPRVEPDASDRERRIVYEKQTRPIISSVASCFDSYGLGPSSVISALLQNSVQWYRSFSDPWTSYLQHQLPGWGVGSSPPLIPGTNALI